MPAFRFSPNPNQAHRINWREWSTESFATAQAENKPVLLSISAVWCYWCHVMDDTSYSDPDVIRYINDYFLPIRVDHDHRPDINARYNLGGWPSTAFLTAHGGLISGATYLPPDQLLAMLTEVRHAYEADRPQLYEPARDFHRRKKEQVARFSAGQELPDHLVNRVARILAGAYDAANGGFGDEPKFPNPSLLSFLVHLTRTTGESFYRAMLEKTLDSMAAGQILDQQETGFFRHSNNSDWSSPQLEKLAEDNIALAQGFLDSGMLLGDQRYIDVAAETVDYLLSHLFDSQVPGFHGSQGAHSEYFLLGRESRRDRAAPEVDPSCYVDANCRAVTLLLDASWGLGRPELENTALGVLARIDSFSQDARLCHVYPDEGPGIGPVYLSDWAWLLSSLMSAHAYTAEGRYLDRAKSVAVELVDRYFDGEHGGFFDIEEDSEAVGLLQIREKPLPDNMAAALALLKLYEATRNNDYLQLVEATLGAFVPTYREFGEFSAPYGLAVDLWRHSPVEITIEGQPNESSTQAMLRAAARVTYPHLVVKPTKVLEPEYAARALVCLDTICLPPVVEPGDLAETVQNALSGQESPFQNIFELYPRV